VSRPFLTFLTPTYKRPNLLQACMASVQAQTAVEHIEHIVLPDYVGRGVGGMFTQLPLYAESVHGDYVHILCDDDVLANTHVVAQVRKFAEREGMPPVLLVKAQKGDATWPAGKPWPPRCGAIDLGCCITRRDVWQRYVEDYGSTYEGDFAFADAVHRAGYEAESLDLLFLRGKVMRGAAEAA
jgi:hypothetical protein